MNENLMKILVLPLVVGMALISANASAQDAIDTANTWLGVPYYLGGDSPNGIDCSALTRRAFRELQIELPRTSQQQWSITSGTRQNRSQLERNDLVFFATGSSLSAVSHVGIYKGNGQFINAKFVNGRPDLSKVSYDNIDDKYWRPRFLGGGRVLRNVEHGSRILLRPWAANSPKWTFLMAYNGGGGQVASNSPNPWDWEKWNIFVNGGGPVYHGSWICLQAKNSQFLSTDGSWRPATANRNGVAGWEWFYVERENGPGVVRSGDRIRLRGWQGMYLGANFNYGDWSAGCWYGWGGWGGWETLTVVLT